VEVADRQQVGLARGQPRAGGCPLAFTWAETGQLITDDLSHGPSPQGVRIQDSSPSFKSEPFLARFKLTFGRRSERLHPYPAYGGWAQGDGTILRVGC
jgi:hypothetical protein